MKKALLSVFVLFITFSTYAQTWNLTGNSGTTPGTNFLGTTDNQSLVFKVNNINAGLITSNSSVTGFGLGVLTALTSGTLNIGIGSNALYSNTTGNYNSAIGSNVLYNNVSGSGNSGIGYYAFYANTTGSWNTAAGYQSLSSNLTGNYNTASGTNSLMQNTSGNYNSAFGTTALYSNSGASFNTAVGDSALVFNTTGVNNIAMGSQAGLNITTGSNNIIIGKSVNAPNGTANNQLIIGNGSNIWLQGVGGAMGIPGTLSIGADNTGATYLPAGYSLAVNGKAIATSMIVQLRNSWPDYVFKPEYKLPALSELKTYVSQNHHLPDMPSEQQIAKDGLDLGNINKLLTKKVEELTLYLIEKDKEMSKEKALIKRLEETSNIQEERIKKLEEEIQLLTKPAK